MNHRTRTRRTLALPVPLAALAALILLVPLAGCGEKQESIESEVKLQGLNLLLDWTPNPDHAGIYTGIAKNRFRERALVVKPQVPSDAAAVIQQVVSGRADLGISYQNEVMAARDKGAKVKAVAALVSTPLNSLIWLKKSGIRSVQDLAGKRVGTSGAYPSAYLQTILERNGVNPNSVKDINVGYDLLPALVGGKVDAIIGAYWNVEGVQLKQQKRPATVIPVDKEGVPRYDELVLIASETALADGKKREKIRRFLAGLEEGTADAVADPEFAAKALLAADESLKPAFVKESLAVTLPVLEDKDPANPYGYMSPDRWLEFANWMRDNRLLDNAPDAAAAYDNSLLPPASAN